MGMKKMLFGYHPRKNEKFQPEKPKIRLVAGAIANLEDCLHKPIPAAKVPIVRLVRVGSSLRPERDPVGGVAIEPPERQAGKGRDARRR
jgi:hypothetical protein